MQLNGVGFGWWFSLIKLMKLKNKSRVLRNSLYFSIIQIGDYALPFLMVPILVGRLGYIGYSEVAVAQSLALVFYIVIDWGFLWYATREYGSLDDNRGAKNSLIVNVFAARVLLAAFVWVFLLIFSWLRHEVGKPPIISKSEWLLIMYVGILGYAFQPFWLVQAENMLKGYSLAASVVKIITFTFVFYFVLNEADSSYALAFLVLPNIIFGIFVTLGISVKFKIFLVDVNWGKVSAMLLDAKSMQIITLGSTAYRGLSVPLLKMMSSAEHVALYSVCEKISRALQDLAKPLANAVYLEGIKGSDYKNSGHEKNLKILLYVSVAVTSLATLFCAYYSQEILGFLHVASIKGSQEVVLVMLVVPVVGVFNSVFGLQSLVPLRREHILAKIVVFCAGLHLGLALLFFAKSGSLYMAAMYLATECIILILLVIFHRFVLNKEGAL